MVCGNMGIVNPGGANFSCWGQGKISSTCLLCVHTAQWPEQLYVRTRKDLHNVHARGVES